MLSDTLLDSSPARESVLYGRHWLTTVAAAAAGFCLAWFGLPLLTGPTVKMLAAQSLIAAAVFFFTALMLAYVYADSRRLGLRPWPWIALAFMLNIAGFVSYLVYSAAKTGNWKRASLPIAYMAEVMAIGVMVIIPLVHSEALPKALDRVSILPPPPPAAPPAAASHVPIQRISVEDLEKEPAVIPKTIAKFRPQPAAPFSGMGVVGSVPGSPGGQDGVIDSLIGVMAPPPPAPAKPATPGRIERGGVIEAANLIYGPKSDYPQLAKMASIQGAVRLEALIATDGTIKDLKIVSGHPLLVKAALEAVEHWRYRPTLLNGQPVEVETENGWQPERWWSIP
ncbi:MAG TPA: energy transducer TonB [Terriglobia bacterium]|nr:energy transducer TonB [Terriglobia bacterium]